MKNTRNHREIEMDFYKLNLKTTRANYRRNCRMDNRWEWIKELTLRYPFRFIRLARVCLAWVLYLFKHPECEGCNDCGFTFMWPNEEVGIDVMAPDFDQKDPRQFCNCTAGKAVKDAVETVGDNS